MYNSEAMQSYSQEVGDGIVQKLDVDFKAKRTTLLLERWGDAEEAERITVVFVGVELQDFKDFSDFNILHDINEAESPAQFWDEYREWLEARRNYLSVGVLENIAADTTLRYFSLQMGGGFDGFIICKDLILLSNKELIN